MNDLLKTAPLVLVMAMAGPLFAQTAESDVTQDTSAAGAAEEAPNALTLSMGEEESSGPKPGDIYIEATFADWQLRCIKSAAEDAKDPCQLYQLLNDDNDNPVAEINIFPLTQEGGPAAGATVITPLETLLTQQLGMSVDGSSVKRYPFSWCSTVGCFARLGFAESDIAAFKRGSEAMLTIVPVAAPDQKVNLTVSLSGFTAAFDSAKERLAQ